MALLGDVTALLIYDLQRIEEGITEDEAWRLFQQIVDALVHVGARGIVSPIFAALRRFSADMKSLASSRHQTYKHLHRCALPFITILQHSPLMRIDVQGDIKGMEDLWFDDIP